MKNFVVGKQYSAGDGGIYTCVGYTTVSKNPILAKTDSDHVCHPSIEAQKHWKEYKTPVVYTQYLWYILMMRV